MIRFIACEEHRVAVSPGCPLCCLEAVLRYAASSSTGTIEGWWGYLQSALRYRAKSGGTP